MRVELTNQHDSNLAKAVVEVGCGLDGAEWNEPSFTYAINADGVEIHRMTDHGETIGHRRLSVTEMDILCGVAWVSMDEVSAFKARLDSDYPEQPAPFDNSAVVVPVVMPDGAVDFRPLAENDTPTYLIIVKPEKAEKLDTSDPNGDRISIGGVTLAEAVGKFLMANPSFSYDDIDDHMEV